MNSGESTESTDSHGKETEIHGKETGYHATHGVRGTHVYGFSCKGFVHSKETMDFLGIQGITKSLWDPAENAEIMETLCLPGALT